MYAYCKTNDILIRADCMDQAKAYGIHRLSPAYGHVEDRSDNLNLVAVSDTIGENLEPSAIYWDIKS